MIKKVEVRLKNTPDYDPDEFDVKITTTPDATEESTVATLINPDRIGNGKNMFRVPPGVWLAPNTVLLPGDDPPQPNPPTGLQTSAAREVVPGIP